MSKAKELLHEELQALRRARDQAATQIQTAKNALNAGVMTLTDISSRLAGIEACLSAMESGSTGERGE